MSLHIHNLYDQDTATFTYIIHDTETKACAIIDSVQNYDQFSGKAAMKSADEAIVYVKEKNLSVHWILETHIHADHLTAATYLKKELGGKIAIGSHIEDVIDFWGPLFNMDVQDVKTHSPFDKLLHDGEKIPLGNLEISIIHTPGHTPACLCYHVDNAVFVGDTIFMPDLGTARTDFPGGSAESLYDSIQKILHLADETVIYVGHDYPPQGRELAYRTTVADQKLHNILVNQSISKEDYVMRRNERDKGKAVPKLLLPSLQVNLRAGEFGPCEDNGKQYIKIPVIQQ